MTALRLGVVGFGKAGRRHAEAAVASDGVELAAVVEASSEVRELASERLACPVAKSVQELLDEGPAPDAAVVALPHAALAAASLELIEREVHVLVEKPMATRVEDGRRLVEAAASSGVRLMVGYNHRFRPEYQTAKQWIDDGRIGRPRLLVEQMVAPAGPLPPWVWDPAVAGGGMLTYNGAHVVDHLMWLAGEPVEAVAATTTSLHFDEALEDTAAAWLHFASGALGSIVVHKSNVAHRQASWETRVVGTSGALKIDRDGAHLSADGMDADVSESGGVHPDHRFGLALEAFRGAVVGGHAPDPDGRQGLEVLRCLEALYRSATTGSRVTLPTPLE